MQPKPFIATAVQHPPVFLDLEKSIEKASDLIAQAAQGGAKLIVFPETWLTGYPIWLDLAPGAALWGYESAEKIYHYNFTQSPALTDLAFEKLCKVAKSSNAYVVMGLHERSGNTIYDTTLYIKANGNILGHHRKLVPTNTERLIWG